MVSPPDVELSLHFSLLLMMNLMTDVTSILNQIEDGDPLLAGELLPLVYEELRKLAAAKLADEKPGQTLQAIALFHDAYIRLVDVKKAQHLDSRGHYFAAGFDQMCRRKVGTTTRRWSKADLPIATSSLCISKILVLKWPRTKEQLYPVL